MNKVKNKWNGGFYLVVNQTDKNVTLQCCNDGRRFTITKNAFFENYFEKRVDKLN